MLNIFIVFRISGDIPSIREIDEFGPGYGPFREAVPLKMELGARTPKPPGFVQWFRQASTAPLEPLQNCKCRVSQASSNSTSPPSRSQQSSHYTANSKPASIQSQLYPDSRYTIICHCRIRHNTRSRYLETLLRSRSKTKSSAKNVWWLSRLRLVASPLKFMSSS